MGRLIEVNSPLVKHYIGIIRDVESDKNTFSSAIENLAYLMLPQITSDLLLTEKRIQTPLTETTVASFYDKVLLIPILRAGLALLEPLKKVIPDTAVGYIGMKRGTNADGITADMYYENLPPNLHEYNIMILDCIIATGSSIALAINHLKQYGVAEKKISVISVMSARPGLDSLCSQFPDITIATCQIDEKLNEKGFIVPGLGDAGNRYNGYDIEE